MHTSGVNVTVKSSQAARPEKLIVE